MLCHPETGHRPVRDLTTIGSDDTLARSLDDGGRLGDPLYCIDTADQRKIPRAGFAAVQDDIAGDGSFTLPL